MYFKSGKRAVLRSSTIKADSPKKCMSFAYHMHGTYRGKLMLNKKAVDGKTTRMFYNTETEKEWRVYDFTLTTESYDYQVIYWNKSCYFLEHDIYGLYDLVLLA